MPVQPAAVRARPSTRGLDDPQAGAFTPFTLTIGNPDGDQALHGPRDAPAAGRRGDALVGHAVPGIAAGSGTAQCGPESLIGHSTASSGLGGDPFTLPGSVYLTDALRWARRSGSRS